MTLMLMNHIINSRYGKMKNEQLIIVVIHMNILGICIDVSYNFGGNQNYHSQDLQPPVFQISMMECVIDTLEPA